MSAEAYGLNTHPTPEAADFCLSPEEVAKGQQAAETYINSIKPGEARRGAKEALETLAAVISGGVCGGTDFPWHQVRAYHGALALSRVKERGAPARIEALRCRHDDTRKYQQVPENFKTKEVQRMRTSLKRVIEECRNLGFISEEDMDLAVQPPAASRAPVKSTRERELTEGEVRALLSACDMEGGVSGCRDALMIGLAFNGGLKTVDLINLTLDDLHFDQKSGRVTIRHKAPGAKRAKRIGLANEDLISLEDWLEARGRDAGALFCPIGRGQKIEHKRMSAAAVKEFCDLRAEQAGVLPFAPNDLARSGTQKQDTSKRRRADEAPVSELSPLYGDAGEVEDEETERINFPYRVRVGR